MQIDIPAGIIASLFGILALLGWSWDVPVLASLGIDKIPMAPSTAALFLAYGAAVVLRGATKLESRRGRIGRFLVIFGSLTAAALFITSAFGILPEVETMGLNLSVTVPDVPATGHMSPITSGSFILLGAAFLLIDKEKPSRKAGYASLAFASLVLIGCFVFLLGYLLGEPLLYGGTLIPPALSTITAFTVLSLAQAVSARRCADPSPLNSGDAPSRNYVVILALLASIGGIIVAGYFYYRGYEKKFRSEIESRLSAISELKVGELNQFRKERLNDASEFMGNIDFARSVRRFLGDSSDAEAAGLIINRLSAYVAADRYEGADLLDTSGETRLSVPNETDRKSSLSELRTMELLRSAAPAFWDFHRDERDGRIRLAVLVPLLDKERGNELLGLLILRIDPSVYLYPFIKKWPVPSRSAETLLVRREGDTVLFLNDLRYRENAALRLRFSLREERLPAVKAVSGMEGVTEGLDYRGEPVITSLRSVPGSPWFIVAKMDSEEAFAPLKDRMWSMIAVVTGLGIVSAAGIWMYLKTQNLRSYSEKLKTLKALQETTTFLESLLNYANSPIIVWDSDFRVTRFNRAFEKLTGRKASEIVGGPIAPLVPPEQVDVSLLKIRDTATGERWETVEIDITAGDGTVRRLLWNSAPIFSPDGQTVVATIAQGYDVTDTRNAEKRLIEQLEELRRWQNVMLGREERIIELKKEVNELLATAKRPNRYQEGVDVAR